jgi:hypothetical protein
MSWRRSRGAKVFNAVVFIRRVAAERGMHRPLRVPVKQEDFRRASLTISMTCISFGVNLSGFISGQEQEENLSKTKSYTGGSSELFLKP